jgi:O-antigen ligase
MAATIRVLGLGLTVLLAQSFLWAQDAPVVLKLGTIAIGFSAAVWPGGALLVLAGLVPFGRVVPAELLGAPSARFTEAIVLAFLAGWQWTRLRSSSARESESAATASVRPFAAVVLASVLVEFGVLRYWKDYWWPFTGKVLVYMARDYLGVSLDPRPWGLGLGGFSAFPIAAMLLAGLALAMAVRQICIQDASFGRRLLRISVVAAGGTAVLSIWSAVQAVTAGGHDPLAVVGLQRFAVHTLKVNTAASYFVLLLPIAIGLAWEQYQGRRRHGITFARLAGLLTAAVLITAGLILTGSRAGLFAGLVVVLAAAAVNVGFALPERRWRRTDFLILGAGAAAVLVVGAVFYQRLTAEPPPGQASTSVALRQRVLMADASLRMLKDYPVFGVGIGQYPLQSRTYMPDALRSDYASFNAHNQFLQMTAELGLIGGTLFIGMVSIILWRALAAFRKTRDAHLGGILAGLIAFVITCLSGQPLLIGVVAFSFWMIVGVALSADSCVCAEASPSSQAVRPRRTQFLTWFAVAMAVSIPFRVWQGQERVNLALADYGFSPWRNPVNGPPYRLVRDEGTFFTYSQERRLTLPIRRDSAAGRNRLDVTVSLNGRRVRTLTLTDDQWQTAELSIPVDVQRRFNRVDLEVRAASGAAAQVRVAQPVIWQSKRGEQEPGHVPPP